MKTKISYVAVLLGIGLSVGSMSATASTSWTVADFIGGVGSAGAVSAWSTDGDSNTLRSASYCDYSPVGYGIGNATENGCSAGTGPHSADNINHTDLFLLEFSAPVALSKVTIGWNGTDDRPNSTSPYSDSDISVLAYVEDTTGKTASSAVSGKTLAGLLGTSTTAWNVIGNFSDVGASNGSSSGGNTGNFNNSTVTPNPNVYSSWWLISAYSRSFGLSWSEGNDAFKLVSVEGVVGTPPPPPGRVPEPSALLMVGTALLGMVGLRRRGKVVAA